jgi:MFS family permease
MGWVVFSPIVNMVSTKFGVKKTIIIGILGMSVTILAISNSNLSQHLLLLTFLFGSFSAVQVLVWHYFNKICSSSISGLGIAVTNMIITLIVELGQLSTGMLIDIFNKFDISPHTTITYSFIIFTILGYMVYRKLKVD